MAPQDLTAISSELTLWRREWKKQQVRHAPKSIDGIFSFLLQLCRKEWDLKQQYEAVRAVGPELAAIANI